MRTCTIHDERPNTNGNTFAVMLLPVPSLPEGMEAASGEMVMQAVIGATDHELGEGKAGWVVLSSEEKDAIGYALHEHGAEVHRWYWCQLWEQDDSVQETHAVVPREFEAAMASSGPRSGHSVEVLFKDRKGALEFYSALKGLGSDWVQRQLDYIAARKKAAPAPVASAEDVERVAEALWLAQTLRLLRDAPEQARLEYAELDDATKGHLRWDARAALRAMGYEVAARD